MNSIKFTDVTLKILFDSLHRLHLNANDVDGKKTYIITNDINENFNISTGFSDKNNDTIYLNDYVRLDNKIYKVCYNQLMGTFVVDSEYGQCCLKDCYYDCEIIK